MGFKEDLAAAKEHIEDRVKTPEIEFALNGVAYAAVFFRVSTREWSAVTIKHPPREGINMDTANGYDISGVAREISAEHGRLIEDGEEKKIDAAEWAALWEVISPKSARMLEANVWFLHERDAELEIEAAKKASAPRRPSKTKPS